MTQYSEDLRERAMELLNAGETIRLIAAALAIAPSCASKLESALRLAAPRLSSGPFTTPGLVAELTERGIKTERRRFGCSSGPRT